MARERELQHDSDLFRAYREVDGRLREQGADIDRVVLQVDLRREYQRWLQEHTRGRADSDGRPDRDRGEIEEWARKHDLPYFEDKLFVPEGTVFDGNRFNRTRRNRAFFQVLGAG